MAEIRTDVSPLFMPTGKTWEPRGVSEGDFQRSFYSIMRAMEAEILAAGVHMAWDSEVRRLYAQRISAMSSETQLRVMSGEITWKQAAQHAQETRNAIMGTLRHGSTPIGKAWAQNTKQAGKTLDVMIAEKTQSMYPGKDFNRLSVLQQNEVYKHIVISSGNPNKQVSAQMQRLSHAGRGLVALSIAVSTYNIATAEDKVAATKREVAVSGAGIGGAVAGGALAGLACGPGAPACVTISAFVGGALAAFGMDYLFW